MNIQEQLAVLRKTVANIDGRYAAQPVSKTPSTGYIEGLLHGSVVETKRGRHFQTEKLYARQERYGSYYISGLLDMRHDHLQGLSGGRIANAPPGKLAFLDTETTGLAGGSGTCAFLIGVGSIDAEGFRVRQFFMRDFDEEASMLESLGEYLQAFDVLVTYNGRTYDQPLLETRYTMSRSRHPFARMEHLDLLYGARRLFKLRLENCRLVNLENQILGVERENDIPGELIPYTWFEYLRTQRAIRLAPVFHHNILDIVSLACLTAIIPESFSDPVNARARHGMDLLGLARWLQMADRLEEALTLLRRAVDLGLPDQHLFRALFEAGTLEKKMGRDHASLATFSDLSLSPNPYRVRAWEELAKHYEHRERNFSMALECVRAARNVEDNAQLNARQERLERKCAKVKPQRRLRLTLN